MDFYKNRNINDKSKVIRKTLILTKQMLRLLVNMKSTRLNNEVIWIKKYRLLFSKWFGSFGVLKHEVLTNKEWGNYTILTLVITVKSVYLIYSSTKRQRSVFSE